MVRSSLAWILLCAATACASESRETTVTTLPAEMPAEQLLGLLNDAQRPLVLDVRSHDEFDAGHIPGAVLVPHDSLAAALPNLNWPKDRAIVIYCRSGRRSELARGTLREAGYQSLSHLVGDMNGWKAAGMPIEGAPAAAQP